MARKLQLKHESAIYHFMSRGERRASIFHDDHDRESFMQILSRCCEHVGWQMHALRLMPNHFQFEASRPRAAVAARGPLAGAAPAPGNNGDVRVDCPAVGDGQPHERLKLSVCRSKM